METAILNNRVDRLEGALADYINESRRFANHVDNAILNLTNNVHEISNEMQDFKDEMKEFKDEMKAGAKQMRKQWGELANKMGTIVEDIIAPALPRIVKEYFDMEGDNMIIRWRKPKPADRSAKREFDVIIIDGDKIVLNETKATARSAYAENYVEFIKSGEFFEYFPEFEDKQLIPIFSSLNIPTDVVNYLTKNGIFAMEMTDSDMDLVNFEACRMRMETGTK